MAILTDLPTELHRKVVEYMVTVTEQNYTPRLVYLAGISAYWNDLVHDAVGRLYVRNKKDSARWQFEAKRVRRLEKVQERVIKLRL
ncbi:hypothetical protein LTR70_005638 [Exophiala xenobiotica]|uniref:F-box domain-containing protein n=1 Tax=Lithohypha guttulata TaxID=1690604 RepID=A0ABR0JZ85_9EURO|nr:hypothetical protein LTR24_008841 [Lithohypha guttulata]KAK5317958.1 hypothetical protein LTR70_005638 [Exophiala xenobiotica]